MTKRSDDRTLSTHDNVDGRFPCLHRLTENGLPPRAVDANLRDLARDTWLLLHEPKASELQHANESLEIFANVLLHNMDPDGDVDPFEVAATPLAVYGAVNAARLVVRTGLQGAIEQEMTLDLLVDGNREIVAFLMWKGEATGVELAESLGMDASTVSRRLKRLKELGAVHLVRGSRGGQNALTRAANRACLRISREHWVEASRDILRRQIDSRLELEEDVDVAMVDDAKVQIERSNAAVLESTPWTPRPHLGSTER